MAMGNEGKEDSETAGHPATLTDESIRESHEDCDTWNTSNLQVRLFPHNAMGTRVNCSDHVPAGSRPLTGMRGDVLKGVLNKNLSGYPEGLERTLLQGRHGRRSGCSGENCGTPRNARNRGTGR